MPKSIKLKNDTYLDSKSIVHNKELLSDILNNIDIVESGSSVNGSWTKYANGKMVQYHRIIGNQFNCTKLSSTTRFYYQDENNSAENIKVWNYPIEFADTDIIAHVEVSSSAYSMCSLGYVQKSRMAGYCVLPYSVPNITFTWHFLAIGNWK